MNMLIVTSPALFQPQVRQFFICGCMLEDLLCSGVSAQSLLFGRWMVCEGLIKCPLEILYQCCSKRTPVFRPAEVQLRSSECVLSEEDWSFAMKYILIQHCPRPWCKIQIKMTKSDWSFLKTCKPCKPFSPLWQEKDFEICHRKSLVTMPFMFYRHYIFLTFKTQDFY